VYICIVAIYACAFTCGRSFTVLSFRDDLISFGVFLVFSPTLLSLYYFYLIINLLVFLLLFCYLFLLLLLLLSFIVIIFIISTELLALCDGCLGWGCIWRAGLVAGFWVGQAFGVLLLPGFGVGSSSPRFLGTQPPCATQALIIYNMYVSCTE